MSEEKRGKVRKSDFVNAALREHAAKQEAMNAELREIATQAISQAQDEGLANADAEWMATGALIREARDQGVIGDELPAEFNAAAQAIVGQVASEEKSVGRPRRGALVRINVTRKFSPELIKAMEEVTTNQSEFIEEWMWKHPHLRDKKPKEKEKK